MPLELWTNVSTSATNFGRSHGSKVEKITIFSIISYSSSQSLKRSHRRAYDDMCTRRKSQILAENVKYSYTRRKFQILVVFSILVRFETYMFVSYMKQSNSDNYWRIIKMFFWKDVSQTSSIMLVCVRMRVYALECVCMRWDLLVCVITSW